jgi:hypothetical protein
MSHISSGRARSLFNRPAKVLFVGFLSVAGFSVTALNAAPASAAVTNIGASATALSAELRAHVAPGTWSSAIEIPGSAALNTGGNAGIIAISCTSSGNCVAGGNYLDASTHLQAFVVTESGGTWGNAVEVPGTAALNAGGSAVVNAISCTSNGNCGAGGSYTDVSGDIQGFVVSETGGAWGTATQVIDPSAIGSVNSSGVLSISCIATGSCSAVGLDTATGGVPVGFAVSETSGAWSTATDITMTSTLGAGGTLLSAVSCTSPGDCAAIGTGVYADASVHGGAALIPFTVNELNGTWGSASLIPGIATLNVGLVASPAAISCGSAGSCSAGGTYTDGLGNEQAFVVSETNGTWGSAVEAPGTSSLNVGAAVLDSISCTSTGNCGASGLYTTATLTENFVMNETNGTWSDAVEVPGSSLFIGGAGVNPNPISCGSAGNCSSAGSYIDTLGNYQAYVITEKAGTWGNVLEVPGSSALNTAGGAQTTAISCSADSGCGIGGYYATSATTYQAFVTDMTPNFTPQSAFSLTSTHGKVGTSLKLATSGGSGTGGVTFSVVNGSAKGCAISGSSLSATSAGTCVVTATKAGDTTYLANSSTANVALALPARPATLTVAFGANSSALSSSAKSELASLSKKLVRGASVTVTGSARGNAKLAKGRAAAVASYLAGKDQTHATIKTVTSSTANTVTVATTKQ